MGCQGTHQSIERDSPSPRKVTRPEGPCCKRPGSMKGKTTPIFPFFVSKLRQTALTYSLGPRFGWHGSFGLLAATQPCRVELWMAGAHGKGQNCHVLPTSPQTPSICCFFHMGAPPDTDVELVKALVVFLSINISYRVIRDDRCGSSPPSSSTPRNTVCDIPGSAPVSDQPAPVYTQTALPITLQNKEFWGKKKKSTLHLAVKSWEKGLVWWLHCIVWQIWKCGYLSCDD